MNQGRTIVALTVLVVAAGIRCPAQTPCATWTETPVPFNSSWDGGAVFEDVAVMSPDSAWAVGEVTVGNEAFTLAMYWNGTSWTQYPTPSPSPYPGGTSARLFAVGATSPNDVWAGGARIGDAGGLSFGDWILVEHFDGVSWQVVPSPPPPGGVTVNFSGTRILEIAALATDDVWFGGYWASPNAQFTVDWYPLAMHWDGSSLTVHQTPIVYSGGAGFGIVSMSALAPDDIWAACATNTASGASVLNVILHWDGTSWTQVAAPSSASHTLRKIIAFTQNDVWVFGKYYYPSAPYALHWNGTSWTEVSGAPYATTAAALGPGAIYCGTNVVNLYDGSTYATVESFPGVSSASILSMERSAWCGIWAVGRMLVASQPRPFAAHMGLPGSTQASTTVRTGCFFPAPPASIYASGPPALGSPFVVAVGDPSNAAALTPSSTQSYLFVSAQSIEPCGLGVGGFGVGSAPGEVLIDVSPAGLVAVLGPSAWGGPGMPAIHVVQIPGMPLLAGLRLHEQAVLIDPTGPSAPGLVTSALDLVIGY